MELEELLQQIDIGEDQDFEFKLADGGLPKSLWETVSAFANTDGGYIILGVKENRQGKLEVEGVRNLPHLKKTFWDSHNNPERLSVNICSQSDLKIYSISEAQLLSIRVPQAPRQQRPVYINKNPITGTYKRNYEGDYRCTEAEVRQMLRDASDAPQDFQLLEYFGLKDLDPATIKTYRQRFSNREPDHPWLVLDDLNLLLQLGGWKQDRNSGKEGLTVAGLLMFGQERSILDAFPYYQLDYQERLSNDPEIRWTYRLTLDGKWEPNLFNFYHKIYGRLVKDLEIPFKLDENSIRKGETHVHEALREAIVNTLIHADHQSTLPIQIVKLQEKYFFSNPGRLRIPLNVLYQGGFSDPRNPNLQKMFQMIGLGEKAGSGFGKILRAWCEQQWFQPLVTEDMDLGLTQITLPTISLIPKHIESDIKTVVGNCYHQLTELERVILVLSHHLGVISNQDIQIYRNEHPRDIGECLKNLVHNGWLCQSGQNRWTRYSLANTDSIQQLSLLSASEQNNWSSEHYGGSSEHYSGSSEHYSGSSEHYRQLENIAQPIRDKRRSPQKQVREVLLQLCAGQYLPLRTLATLLGREPDSIRNHYIQPMIMEGLLECRYPHQNNHPQQAYKTVAAPSLTKSPTPIN